MPTTETNYSDPARPDYRRPEVKEAQPDLDLIHDLLAGTRRMHDQAGKKQYIRKWKDEKPAVYQIRHKMEQVYEGLGRTLSAAVGMIFQKPPELTFRAEEARFRSHFDNLDGAGTKLEVAAKRFTEWAIRDGLSLILVDFPTPPEGRTVTAADEVRLGLRPTWAFYDRVAVCSWRTAVIANREQLVQLVLHESADATDNAYGITQVDRYRVLRLLPTPTGFVATWQLWQAPGEAGGEFLLVGAGEFRDAAGRPFDVLPVAVGYAGRTDAPLTAIPPLLGVAWANLGHWQQATNLRFYREVAAFPNPTVIGDIVGADGAPGQLRLGPMVGLHLKGNGASFTWAELQGSSLEQVEKGVLKKEQEMAALGMSFLARDTRAAETAEAKRLDATAENSTLATSAQGVEDAWNLALEFHARYLGLAATQAPTVRFNRDFDRMTLDATWVAAIGALVKEGFPVRMAVQMLAQGGVIPTDDPVELDMLALEWEAGGRAAEDARALDAQRTLPRAA